MLVYQYLINLNMANDEGTNPTAVSIRQSGHRDQLFYSTPIFAI